MKHTIYKPSRGSKARPNAPALRAGSPLRGAGVQIPSSAFVRLDKVVGFVATNSNWERAMSERMEKRSR